MRGGRYSDGLSRCLASAELLSGSHCECGAAGKLTVALDNVKVICDP